MDQDSLQPQSPKGRASVGESLTRGKDALGSAAANAVADASSDLEALRNDLASLKSTLARFMAEAGGEAARSAREVSSSVAGQVGDTASDLAERGARFAASTGEQAKSLAGEIEAFARRNPLGALAGAVAVGFIIGMWGRRS
ncbi:MAG: hypothetical protein JO228_08010 [Xanthobacteraceae bacterium]|nr:hypothetical protein [Xanthobacteraceae bacterium]